MVNKWSTVLDGSEVRNYGEPIALEADMSALKGCDAS